MSSPEAAKTPEGILNQTEQLLFEAYLESRNDTDKSAIEARDRGIMEMLGGRSVTVTSLLHRPIAAIETGGFDVRPADKDIISGTFENYDSEFGRMWLESPEGEVFMHLWYDVTADNGQTIYQIAKVTVHP